MQKPRSIPLLSSGLSGFVLLGLLHCAAAKDSYSTMDEFQQEALLYPKFVTDNLWILIAAGLVFLMHLGFAALETGLTRQKNAVNVLFKNVFVVSAGLLTYALWGFNLMYPGELTAGLIGFSGFGVGVPSGEEFARLTPAGYGLDMTIWADFIFQAMFAATAATIVSGAVAERVKLSSFMLFTVLLVGFLYPIAASWKWGGGWLDQIGFYDFAGSTIVHGAGGAAALACVLLLGPRNGKYLPSGGIRPIPGHNMPLAALGVFLLWFGWFGFNGGSVLNADPAAVSFVFVTTGLAGAAGAVGAMMFSWGLLKKPDLSMSLNGILAGLVGITAGADVIHPRWAVVIGLIAGFLVVAAVILFDRIRIDDPAGAISVHGVCGIWGTLAVGIFSSNPEHSFWIQLLGVAAIFTFVFSLSFLLFRLIRASHGIRVTDEEEAEGLDLSEHGQEAYPDFGKVTG